MNDEADHKSPPAIDRRNLLLGTSTLVAAATLTSQALAQAQKAAPAAAPATTQPAPSGRKPNILVIFGDDIGQTNISAYSLGLMGYRTPNIDRLASEGMRFTDSYGEQSCTAGRSAFITGQSVYRTGLSKVGLPGAGRLLLVDLLAVQQDHHVGVLLQGVVRGNALDDEVGRAEHGGVVHVLLTTGLD